MSNMKDRCKTIVIEAKNYLTYEDYKRAIIDVIETLTTNGYVTVVKQQIKNTMTIEYNHENFKLSGYWNAWVSESEVVCDSFDCRKNEVVD